MVGMYLLMNFSSQYLVNYQMQEQHMQQLAGSATVASAWHPSSMRQGVTTA